MKIDDIARYAFALQFGQKTGIDLPGEKEGMIPSNEWIETNRKGIWYPGETISISIGQGPLLVTPIQVAAHTALIARRGTRVIPRLFLPNPTAHGEIMNKRGKKQESDVSLKKALFEKAIEGMWRSVNQQGTGKAAMVEGFNVCGKTGTTQTMSLKKMEALNNQGKSIKTHSWFTGFAPRDDPRIVVTILVEFGGRGGMTAAPLARQLFETYRKKYD